MFYHVGDPFAKAVGSYLQRGFQKGVPSLFQSVKFLYAASEKVSTIILFYIDFLIIYFLFVKVQIIDSLLRTYYTNLTKYGTFETPAGTNYFSIC